MLYLSNAPLRWIWYDSQTIQITTFYSIKKSYSSSFKGENRLALNRRVVVIILYTLIHGMYAYNLLLLTHTFYAFQFIQSWFLTWMYVQFLRKVEKIICIFEETAYYPIISTPQTLSLVCVFNKV